MPISFIYTKVTPNPMARGIKNVLDVLSTPIFCTCYAISGDGEKVVRTFLRGVINVTFGLFVLIDVATDMGLTVEPMTVGKLLGHFGVTPGFYMMLPLWGPSNPRDLFGDIVEGVYDPVGRAGPPYVRRGSYLVRQGASIISTRSGVLETEHAIREQSPDYYETFRCLYWQKVCGNPEEDMPIPSNDRAE
jgi:phospholipid-binding lipoprotein MlaA